MSSQPKQKLFYGAYISPEQASKLYKRFDEDESAVDVAIDTLCHKHGLVGMTWLSCDPGEDYSFIIGIRLASWGDYNTQKVDLNYLCAAAENARLSLHGEVLADIRELVGADVELGVWTVSYLF